MLAREAKGAVVAALTAATLPYDVDILCTTLGQRLEGVAPGHQLWVALAGGPGSGKSTLARRIAAHLCTRGVPCAVLGMDGFHLSRAQLDRMPNAEEAHARRGAPFTFDASAFEQAARRLRAEGEGTWPTFDHAEGDPVADGTALCRSARVVIVEGNYLLLEAEPWRAVRDEVFDERWFLFVTGPVARDRVARRNAAAWGWSLERAYDRADANDVPNFELVAESAVYADIVIDATPASDESSLMADGRA